MSSIANKDGDTVSLHIGGFGGDNVFGEVRDGANDPVEDAVVFVLNMNTSEYLRQTTGSDGKYEADLDAEAGHKFQAYVFFTDSAGKEHYISGNVPTPSLTPSSSPYAKGVFLVYVDIGPGSFDVAHPCVAVDGLLYSFEGPGLLHYPNVGAYINRRRAEGRRVFVHQIHPRHVNAGDIHKEARNIRKLNKPYRVTYENCAKNACGLLNAGSKKDTFICAPIPSEFLKKNRHACPSMMDSPGEITVAQQE